MKRLFVLLPTMLAFAGMVAGCTGAEALPLNRALWAYRGLSDYSYTLQVSCFCPEDLRAPVRVTVHGQDATMVYAASGAPATNEFLLRFNTVEKLFALLQEARDQQAARIDVSFDDSYGFPDQVYIDYSELTIDEELGFTVTDFQPLARPTTSLPASG